MTPPPLPGGPSPRDARASAGGPRGPTPGRPIPPDDADYDEVARGAQVLWLRTRLEQALDRLGALPRRVVWLRVVEGWEVEVIAEELGLPPGEVRALGRRGLAALRADLRGTP